MGNKTIFFLLIVNYSLGFSQKRISPSLVPHISYGISNISVRESREDNSGAERPFKNEKGNYVQIGLAYYYPFTNKVTIKLNVFGNYRETKSSLKQSYLDTEPVYALKGDKLYNAGAEFSLLYVLHLKDRRKFFLGLGAFGEYGISGTSNTEVINTITDEILQKEEVKVIYRGDEATFSRTNYGAIISLEYKLKIPIFLGVFYKMGIANVNPQNDKNTRYSSSRTNDLGISLAYHFY